MKQKGQSLIELLVTIALMAIVLPAILTGFISSTDGKAQQEQRLLATPLLKEAEEATRVFRDKNWVAFAVTGTYHPEVSANTWILSPGAEMINGFERSVAISDVYRDADGNIVSSGGTFDPSTKKVVSTVSWTTPHSSSVSSTMYLTRYLSNSAYTQTSYADFNAGTKTNVTIASASGGEVILSLFGGSDWCNPVLSISALDLPKSGVANAVSAIPFQVFAGTGENASGVSFANVTINNGNPPVASIAGTFNGFKTNDVFGETNYAYLATDNNFKEIEIIDLTTSPYSEAGYFNAPGNGSGASVFVSGNIGFMTSGTKLYTFDLSSKSGSRPVLGSITLPASGSEVHVVGNYAYVSVAGSTVELQIIEFSPDGTNLSVVGQADVNGEAAKYVFVNKTGTRAYLATNVSSLQKEFFIIDTSTKTGDRPVIGSYDTNGMEPRGINIVENSTRGILVGIGGEEYQVIDLFDETDPARCGGLEVDSGIQGVSGIKEPDEDVYAYIVTGDATSELKIIKGGFGNSYISSGVFESSTFNALSSVVFNRFTANASVPASTSITYQVAGADANPITGNCIGTTFSFVGPDVTAGTYFTTSSAIPVSQSGTYRNPAQCFRYKAFLSTADFRKTPVLFDMTINFSP